MPRTPTPVARASADWLALREGADASARSRALVRELVARLGPGPLVVHDLGAGTGSMARWLSPLLLGPQHWVLHDRDADLLSQALVAPAPGGAEVTFESRCDDLARLPATGLAGASLVTASALLDMLTAPELDALIVLCAAPGSPVLVTLTVDGEVELAPEDPLDRVLRDAFNDHQRRRRPDGQRLLGPDAAGAAVDRFRALGLDVRTCSSPWRLGASDVPLVLAWLEGWVGAAVEQRPGLAAVARDYLRRRRAAGEDGRLRVTVGHTDLLALPRPRT